MKILFAFAAVLVFFVPAEPVLGQEKPKEFVLYLLPEPADQGVFAFLSLRSPRPLR